MILRPLLILVGCIVLFALLSVFKKPQVSKQMRIQQQIDAIAEEWARTHPVSQK